MRALLMDLAKDLMETQDLLIRDWIPRDNPSYFEPLFLWRGRPLEELTREELIRVVIHLTGLERWAREDHQRTLRMWDHCRKERGE
jgi:hypothetical protein